ncbi:MAG: hypothetical protein LBV42_01110 [Methanobrevibacter sp.]|jgi:hypothetical protein|nr:hypothetical protein [Methanobrevibacter sp.]
MLSNIFKSVIILLILFLSGLIYAEDNNGTSINVCIGDQFILNESEYSFEYDDQYMAMVGNYNGTETFTALKPGNTTITHIVYPYRKSNLYNVSIRDLTFFEHLEKVVTGVLNKIGFS